MGGGQIRELDQNLPDVHKIFRGKRHRKIYIFIKVTNFFIFRQLYKTCCVSFSSFARFLSRILVEFLHAWHALVWLETPDVQRIKNKN
jgi:hypothetical protein